VDAIVAAAIHTADRDGLDAVSMRRLADHLGVSAMTLYGYIPGKGELLDLMLDAVYASMRRTDPPPGTGWRHRVEAVAADNRALFTIHPWAAAVATVRPPLGPGQLAKYEHELNAFDGLPVSDVHRDAALALVLGFVRWHALESEQHVKAGTESGLDDGEWWSVAGPLLGEFVDPGAYPTASRVGTAAGSAQGAAWHPDPAWEFGLAAILDGLAARFDGHAGRFDG
jgi:AcrR family transcriptional regulator